MTKTTSLPSPAAAVDYDATLILAVETSNKNWVLAARVPGLGQVKAKQTIAPRAEALATAIDGYRRRATGCGATVERVIVVYEAGYGGFWLARWLEARGLEVHVVQPSSVPVERHKRRAKSDKIDADLLLRTLLAWLRGEPRVCSMVVVPDEADEDARRPAREREELIRERIVLTNRIGAILATLGIDDYNPLRRAPGPAGGASNATGQAFTGARQGEDHPDHRAPRIGFGADCGARVPARRGAGG